jgi:hypothetical protein
VNKTTKINTVYKKRLVLVVFLLALCLVGQLYTISNYLTHTFFWPVSSENIRLIVITLSYFLSTISFLLILSELFITKQINFQTTLEDESSISRSELEDISSKEDLENNDVDLISVKKDIELDDMKDSDDDKEVEYKETINTEEIIEETEIDNIIEMSLENEDIEDKDINGFEDLQTKETRIEGYDILVDEIKTYSDMYVNEEIESELVDTIAEFDNLLIELKNKIKKDTTKS